MSMRITLWYSWTVRGYWLHLYRSVGADFGRRSLALESDRTGRTWRILSWGGA